ncbi:unnamed protein product [Cyprideis torosa]|uniref:Uncharacterized protein n=1 Tax=Cyprideis torosa TaxID=163714 RepID=A0A7R8W5B5_9CRUS|nr:unnamed protein product [Cyprideis torosa]CAG0885004.1 unnamed protein product [Cyprideis torosa]
MLRGCDFLGSFLPLRLSFQWNAAEFDANPAFPVSRFSWGFAEKPYKEVFASFTPSHSSPPHRKGTSASPRPGGRDQLIVHWLFIFVDLLTKSLRWTVTLSETPSFLPPSPFRSVQVSLVSIRGVSSPIRSQNAVTWAPSACSLCCSSFRSLPVPDADALRQASPSPVQFVSASFPAARVASRVRA